LTWGLFCVIYIIEYMILTIYGGSNMAKGAVGVKEKPMNGEKKPMPCDKSKDACGGKAPKKGK
jgi:hypothetical protein